MDDLSKSLAELGEMIDRQNARIATLEAERDAANLRANGLQEIATRAEADLARKQEIINYIDCATMFLTDETAKAVAALIRPEATAKGEQPPCRHTSLRTMDCDPPDSECLDCGLKFIGYTAPVGTTPRVVEETFDPLHEKGCGLIESWFVVRIVEPYGSRVIAKTKHLASARAAMKAVARDEDQFRLTCERDDAPPTPAVTPEPSGEKALRLVAQVASIVADPYIDAAEKRAQLDAIASEARGGAE